MSRLGKSDLINDMSTGMKKKLVYLMPQLFHCTT